MPFIWWILANNNYVFLFLQGTSKQQQEHDSKSGFILRYVSKTVDELKNTSALLARSVPPSTTEKLATESDKALIKPSDGRYNTIT